VLTVAQAKGLEFDWVVLCDPALHVADTFELACQVNRKVRELRLGD